MEKENFLFEEDTKTDEIAYYDEDAIPSSEDADMDDSDFDF